MLADYPASAVESAFKRYVENRSQFPTPADIIGIIKGRIKRDSVYYKALVSRIESLTGDERIYLQKYEQQTIKDWE